VVRSLDRAGRDLCKKTKFRQKNCASLRGLLHRAFRLSVCFIAEALGTSVEAGDPESTGSARKQPNGGPKNRQNRRLLTRLLHKGGVVRACVPAHE